jgi:hypothetical protein
MLICFESFLQCSENNWKSMNLKTILNLAMLIMRRRCEIINSNQWTSQSVCLSIDQFLSAVLIGWKICKKLRTNNGLSLRSADYSTFSVNNGLSMRTIDQSQCKHEVGSFPRDLREIYWQYFISKNKRKHKNANKN